MSTLLIVESPSKAKTIGKYLGPEFVVKASVGHVRDLPKSNKNAIDIEHGFLPHYEVSEGKEKIVSELTAAAQKASAVVLATDPDREGEAIAWHLAEVLGANSKSKTLNPKRIVFHEITKEAVEEALAHPRAVDERLVKAQEARRVLDRLVGYDLSGLIWKKVRYGLSAGRVQSPALRILMEREREIRAFVPQSFWIITAHTETPRGEKLMLVCSEKPTTEKEADRILEAGRAHPWSVSDVTESEMKRKPRAPFTTSTIQQTASTRLGYAPSRTMRLAQGLYEKGLITYMRTDSTTISEAALGTIHAYVVKTFGTEYLHPQKYETKSKNAQEAHEAIRPTSVARATATASGAEEERLYQLIRARTLASQMSDALVMKTRVTATAVDANIPPFEAEGFRTIFDGWLAADPGACEEDVEVARVAKNEELQLENLEAEKRETQPPGRYTEAGLVKELEKRGIGRPSTYASTIQTLLDRHYVDKINRALHPTDTGEVVSTFLEQNFARIISDTFTAEMEEELDEIARGEREYRPTLEAFYGPFHAEVETKQSIPKLTTLGEADAAHTCPLCGGTMVVKLGRNGKFLSCARFPDCPGARTINGAEMKGPVETGEACPECGEGKLVERDGRFGRFVACNRYPKCKFIKTSAEEEAKKKTGIACPTCGTGEIVERRGRFGNFYSCSDYPKCKFAVNARPTGEKCQLCGSLMVEGTKTIPTRCSSKSCPNHNPPRRARVGAPTPKASEHKLKP